MHWTLPNLRPRTRAMAMASVVFPRPGRSSMGRWPRKEADKGKAERLRLAMEVGGQVFDDRFQHVLSVAACLISVRPALRHTLLYHEPGAITPGNTIVPLLSSTPDDRFHWSVFFVLLRVGEVAARCVRKRP